MKSVTAKPLPERTHMKTTPPKIPASLTPVQSFPVFAQELLEEDATIAKTETTGEQVRDSDFHKMDIRMSVFQNCSFHDCNFEKASFMDIVFQSCDFSNSSFQGAYFERCQFLSCKCMGIDMSRAIHKQVTFEDTNLRYANFNLIRMNHVLFDHVDFTEASMAEAQLNTFFTVESQFQRNDFYKTLLKGIDFSHNTFVSPIVSEPPIELRGICIDMFQAAHLIGLWGITVKQ